MYLLTSKIVLGFSFGQHRVPVLQSYFKRQLKYLTTGVHISSFLNDKNVPSFRNAPPCKKYTGYYGDNKGQEFHRIYLGMLLNQHELKCMFQNAESNGFNVPLKEKNQKKRCDGNFWSKDDPMSDGNILGSNHNQAQDTITRWR